MARIVLRRVQFEASYLYTMKLKIKFVLLYSFIVVGVFSSILPADFDPGTRKTEDSEFTTAIEKIVNTWATHDVTIVANDTRNCNVDRVVNLVAKISAASNPTHLFHITNLSKLHLDNLATASSRTLLFYVCNVLASNKNMALLVQYFNFVIDPQEAVAESRAGVGGRQRRGGRDETIKNYVPLRILGNGRARGVS